MKIEPKATAAIANSNSGQSNAAQDARARAIAMIQGQQPVENANKISPEEMSAVSNSTQEQGQKDTSEAQVAEVKEEAPKEVKKADSEDNKLSAQYEQLARKERALRQQAKDLKAQVDALKAQEAEAKAREEAAKSEYQSKYIPKERLSDDLWGTLSELGISYDQITEAVLSQNNIDPMTKSAISSLKAEVKALRQAQESEKVAYRQAQEAAQKQQYDQAVKEIRNETKKLVFTDPAFETVKETGSVNDVVELIERNYKENGILMTVEEAATEVENHLVEQLTGYAAKIEKIKKKLNLPAPQKADEKKSQSKDEKKTQSVNTLTNAVGVSRKLSARERAILAFKGEKANQ